MVYNFPKNLKPRSIFKKIIPFLDEKEIILLYGMRQTGKTSLLYLLMKFLLKEKKLSAKQIIYLDLENIYDFEKIESLGNFDDFIVFLKTKCKLNLTNLSADRQDKIFVFIDEIQHLTNPASFLKYIYDHYQEKIKFIVTGSSSLEIRKKFTDALTGRVFRFEISSLSFQEFLHFSGLSPFENSFENFCLFGGFPAVSLKKENEIKIKLLKEIYSLYVKRDIKDLGTLEDILSFNKLVGVLASQIGGLISEVNLANAVGISRQTIKNYLFILQNTFVISLLTPYFTNPKKELTKTPKIYLNDNGLRNAVVDNFLFFSKRSDTGLLVENAIFTELKKALEEKVHFWRTERKEEVDFVIEKRDEIIPIEVKYQSFKKPILPQNMQIFINKYQPKKAFIFTRNFEKETNFGETQINFLPCWKISHFFI